MVSCDVGTAPCIKGAAIQHRDAPNWANWCKENRPVPPTAEPRSVPALSTRRLRANPAALSTVSATGPLAILDAGSGRLYTLNDVGARVWQLLRDGSTRSSIVEELQHEYDVPVDVLSDDIERLLRQFADAGLLASE